MHYTVWRREEKFVAVRDDVRNILGEIDGKQCQKESFVDRSLGGI